VYRDIVVVVEKQSAGGKGIKRKADGHVADKVNQKKRKTNKKQKDEAKAKAIIYTEEERKVYRAQAKAVATQAKNKEGEQVMALLDQVVNTKDIVTQSNDDGSNLAYMVWRVHEIITQHFVVGLEWCQDIGQV
jgi:hypothetical protein